MAGREGSIVSVGETRFAAAGAETSVRGGAIVWRRSAAVKLRIRIGGVGVMREGDEAVDYVNDADVVGGASADVGLGGLEAFCYGVAELGEGGGGGELGC